jgi:hypothetical protein
MSQVSPLGDAAPNTQELFNLITQLAHYLKILIRIALTGSIKLERDQARVKAMTNALARLNLLAMDGRAGNAAASACRAGEGWDDDSWWWWR